MTTFAYTTGNPANLTGGAVASMNDISGPFTDLRTFLNGANLDTANLAPSAKPATLLGQFAPTPLTGFTAWFGSPAAGTYWLGAGQTKQSGVATTAAVPLMAFGVGGYAVSGLTAYGRLVCSVLVSDIAPACNFTFGLHGIASVTGTGGTMSLNTSGAVASSGVTFTTPAANSQTQTASSDFAIAALTGIYGLAVVPSAASAANSFVQISAALQIHWV